MDGKTLQQIHEILVERWKQIGDGMEQNLILNQADVLPSQAEMIDIAQTLEQIERDSSLKEQERRELISIEKALAKMTNGSFGICEDCNEEIPSKRLMVLPEARLCANCQALEERQNRNRIPGALAR